MAAFRFDNHVIDIILHHVDRELQYLFELPFPSGYWVSIKLTNLHGKEEIFPWLDRYHRIRIFDSYGEAVEEVAHMLRRLVDR